MDKQHITSILEKIKNVNIAVYGDFCLDAYWIIDKRGSEVSIETGLPAEAVERHYYSPGGAGNVVANVAALQPASITVIGVVGNDIHGRELRSQLQNLGANTDALFIQEESDFQTYTYLKKIIEGKEAPRVDFGVYNKRSSGTDEKIVNSLRQALQNCDALIFNQQVTGSISNDKFIDDCNKLFEEFSDKIVILDSRHFNHRFKNTWLKANEKEVAALNDIKVDPREVVITADIRKYGETIYNKNKKPVFVTCGPRGIMAFDNMGIHEIPGIQLTSKLDTVGAGDTVMSAIACCAAAGVNASEAATFANFAATVTVQKLFTTGTASAEEIIRVSEDPSYIFNPDLAENPRMARYLPGTEFELCDPAVLDELGHIRHAVFDHDGTISTLREGWEDIMHPVMMKSILGSAYDSVDQGTYRKVEKQVLEFIEKTTGIQTIYQMEGLVQMVRDFGFVPEEQILDKYEYKDVYNKALLEVVNLRIDKLNRKELNADDYTVKGSVQFLEGLREREVTCYLASGTDAEDVINEASILGYSHQFNGGMYGALRDLSKFSKKMIIEKILYDHKLRSHELLVLGDGPVEMRECRKFGGIAIGITSNEVRRHGHNPEKRARLIKAGAQILIPDFSQFENLLSLLFNKA
ncbi:MAG: carbohydrate kinase [Cyclobacteriaceae bacterium]|nr:carbohydrate kinase [Cyclobacteriaceae bacterium]